MNLSVFTVLRTEKALPRLSLVGTVLHAASFSWTLADGRFLSNRVASAVPSFPLIGLVKPMPQNSRAKERHIRAQKNPIP